MTVTPAADPAAPQPDRIYRIPTAVFSRLAQCCMDNMRDKPDPGRLFLYGIHIERRDDMKFFAIATNARILSCEFLGYNTDAIPGEVTIRADKDIIALCDKYDNEGAFVVVANDLLYIEQDGVPVEFLDGYKYFIPGKFPDWREIFIDNMKKRDKKKSGALSFDADLISRLAGSSPSGDVVFEQWIPDHGCCFCRDTTNHNWIGFFMLMRNDDGSVLLPAELPDWIE